MLVIKQRVPWTKQPQGVVVTDRRTGLDRVWSAANFSEAPVISGSNTQSRANNVQGKAVEFASVGFVDSNKILLGGEYGGTGSDITFVMVYKRTTTPPQYPVFLATRDVAGGFALTCDDPGNQDQIHLTLPGAATTSSGLTLSTFSNPQCIVATFRVSDTTFFVAQRDLVTGDLRTATGTRAGNWAAGTGVQCVGSRAHGQINMAAILWRNLSSIEAIQLSKNPWQLFAP
jgi:hypothetical protein